MLIERGSEVGGDDVRTSVGTVARIVEAAELEDGRWVLGTVGTRRIRVREWLPDDPYPRADVEDWGDLEPGADALDAYNAVLGRLRRVLALKAELAEPAVDATIELSDDPALGSFQVGGRGAHRTGRSAAAPPSRRSGRALATPGHVAHRGERLPCRSTPDGIARRPMPEEEKSIPQVLTELWEMLVSYAKQETVEPLKGLGRFVAFGVGAAVLGGIGIILLTLAGLRGLQTHNDGHLDGN